MTRKILVSIIAIVMIVGVIGGCFALYYTKGADKEVTISTQYDQLTLSIKNGANTADQGTITIDEISPAEGHTTHIVDITLAASPSTLFDGIHGVFNASLTGDLATYLTATATLLDDAAGDPIASNSDITTAAFGTGYDTALTDTPVYVRLTFTLNAAAIADFSLAAEKTASLSLTWAPVAASVWTYRDDYYYIVGSLSGANKWAVNTENQNITLALTGTTPVVSDVTVIASGVATFAAGDEIKVMKGNSIWIGCFNNGDGFTNNSEQVIFNTAGDYRIDVKHNDAQDRDYFEVTKVD